MFWDYFSGKGYNGQDNNGPLIALSYSYYCLSKKKTSWIFSIVYLLLGCYSPLNLAVSFIYLLPGLLREGKKKRSVQRNCRSSVGSTDHWKKLLLIPLKAIDRPDFWTAKGMTSVVAFSGSILSSTLIFRASSLWSSFCRCLGYVWMVILFCFTMLFEIRYLNTVHLFSRFHGTLLFFFFSFFFSYLSLSLETDTVDGI